MTLADALLQGIRVRNAHLQSAPEWEFRVLETGEVAIRHKHNLLWIADHVQSARTDRATLLSALAERDKLIAESRQREQRAVEALRREFVRQGSFDDREADWSRCHICWGAWPPSQPESHNPVKLPCDKEPGPCPAELREVRP